MGWKFTKSVAPFLGSYSAGNNIECRETGGKLSLVERLVSQASVVGLLLSFGLYLLYVIVFHFNEVNGGLFGISVLALGGMVGIGFGARAAIRLFKSPAVEFDFMEQKICFLSRTRNRRVLDRTISFGNVDSIEIRQTKMLPRRSSTEVYLIELTLQSPSRERVPVCVSGNRRKLEEVLEILGAKTRLKVYSLSASSN